MSTPQQSTNDFLQQILPSSLSIQSLSGGKNSNNAIMNSTNVSKNNSPAVAVSKSIYQHQPQFNNTNSFGGVNSNSSPSSKVSNMSVQVLATSPSTGQQVSSVNGSIGSSAPIRNQVSVELSSASASIVTTPTSSHHQSQQQQRLQQQTPTSQQYSNKIRQKISPVQQVAHSPASVTTATTSLITPENATQMLATMQPQPPSSLGQYFKQTSPTIVHPKTSTQSSPVIQQSPPLFGSPLKNSSSTSLTPTSMARSMSQPSQINLNATNQQFVNAQQSPQQNQQTSLNLSKTGTAAVATGNYFPGDVIRLPTVPIPTTSMFSTMTPVISQAAATQQNYLFTNLPQHSTQPNFDVSMLQSKTGIGPAATGNRSIPVANSNDPFSQLLNSMPK